MRLVALAAEQVRVLVGLEVGQPHDHLLRPERGGDRRHAFGDLAHVELGRARRSRAMRSSISRLQLGRLRVELEQRLRMDADVAVDDELEPREAHAFVGQPRNSNASSGLPTFIMILVGHGGMLVERDVDDLELQQARRRRGRCRPRRRTRSPSLPSSSTVVASPQPTTAGMPSSRAMIAAWQVRPPRLVTIAAARFITGSQSGSVMSVTSTSPACTRSISAADLISAHRALRRSSGRWRGRWPAPSDVAFEAVAAQLVSPRSCDFTVSGRACRM